MTIFSKIFKSYADLSPCCLSYYWKMSQHHIKLDLNFSRFSRKSRQNKEITESLITPILNETTRSQKYIPLQFRDKHFPISPLMKHKQSPNLTILSSPFIKQRSNKLQKNNKEEEQPKYGEYREWESLKQIRQQREVKKTERKISTLQNLNVSNIPYLLKLRETNSTQCQSPKAEQIINISKLQEFVKIRLLGKGKFGDVYLVRHKKTGFMAALKIINKQDLMGQSKQENARAVTQLTRQIKLQLYLCHPNLVQLYDFFNDALNVYLLIQLACDGPLFDALQKVGPFSEETTSIVVRQVLEGVDYMHCKSVIHRDIKLQNIVLSLGMAKICDFGWSVYCPKQFRSTLCGTPLYLSPQILIGKQYNKKIDTWALGALTHQLVTNQNPFKIKSQEDLSKIVTEDFEMNSGSPELRSFITFILRKNPAKRPDTDTIKRHPYIQKYKDLQTSEQLCRFKTFQHKK